MSSKPAVWMHPDNIQVPSALQTRVMPKPSTVEHYLEAMRERAAQGLPVFDPDPHSGAFPPLDVFYLVDAGGQVLNKQAHLVSGWHRLTAAKRCDQAVLVNEHHGTFLDALIFAIEANGSNALQLTAEDRVKGATMLLKEILRSQADDPRRHWPDTKLALLTGASRPTIAKLRKDVGLAAPEVIMVERDGTAYEMKVPAKATSVAEVNDDESDGPAGYDTPDEQEPMNASPKVAKGPSGPITILVEYSIGTGASMKRGQATLGSLDLLPDVVQQAMRKALRVDVAEEEEVSQWI